MPLLKWNIFMVKGLRLRVVVGYQGLELVVKVIHLKFTFSANVTPLKYIMKLWEGSIKISFFTLFSTKKKLIKLHRF